MLKWMRAKYLIPLIFIVGVAQYGVTAVQNVLSGNVVMWTMDSELMESAGPLRYVKDAFLLLLSFTWLIYVSRFKQYSLTKKLVGYYFFWLACITLLSILGIAIGYSPAFFLMAGLRWLMLLHASVGVFFLMRGLSSRVKPQVRILRLFMALSLLDAIVILMQMRAGASIGDIGLARSRLTGMFNNAGVAGFFGFSLALCGMCLTRTSFWLRAILTLTSLFIVFASGTRSMMILIFVILIMQIYFALATSEMRKYKKAIFAGMILIFLVFGSWAYYAMVESVGRGGILEAQLNEGGRISNFFYMFDKLYAADYGELLIGRGIGVGTNTAHSMLMGEGTDPSTYRFNWLIDNAFLTQFFQFGAVGSALFWAGIAAFLYKTGSNLPNPYRLHHRVACGSLFFILFAGNPFEHYFLMMGFAIAIGLSFWGSIEELNGTRQGDFL